MCENFPHSPPPPPPREMRVAIKTFRKCCVQPLRVLKVYNLRVTDFSLSCFSEDVDVLQQLGLYGRRTGVSSSSAARNIPNGIIPFKSGVILTPRARIQAPLHTVIPASYSATNLSLILSLSVHRVNGAYLFSGQVLVRVGQRSSVHFDYDVHDGQWHSLALDIQGRHVSLHTSCGKRIARADLRSKKEEALDAEGSFLLGKMNHNSVPFEGAICQFDIYPSAKAAQNYCDYIKKQCREADTFSSFSYLHVVLKTSLVLSNCWRLMCDSLFSSSGRNTS
uniref:Thrombospondin-like N-terminal domain-containing protein n=1 Tax=Cyclopterus lumpus TaxID=8103 RepID=A0A8C3AHW7_CYCLU